MCLLQWLGGKGAAPSSKWTESEKHSRDTKDWKVRWVGKGRDSTSRRTGRMEELMGENSLCNAVWWSASASSSRHKLSSRCSIQGFFSAGNFLYNSPNSRGYLWTQVHCFSLVQCKRVTRAGPRPPRTRGWLVLVLPLTTLVLFTLCPVFLWPLSSLGCSCEKNIFWAFGSKAGWSQLETVKRMGSFGWKCLKRKTSGKCLKRKTRKKATITKQLWYLWVLPVKHLLLLLVFSGSRKKW